jgi:hypothetical protein
MGIEKMLAEDVLGHIKLGHRANWKRATDVKVRVNMVVAAYVAISIQMDLSAHEPLFTGTVEDVVGRVPRAKLCA